jgi:hypothetical protein
LEGYWPLNCDVRWTDTRTRSQDLNLIALNTCCLPRSIFAIGYEMLLMIAVHPVRHAQQIQEVRNQLSRQRSSSERAF